MWLHFSFSTMFVIGVVWAVFSVVVAPSSFYLFFFLLLLLGFIVCCMSCGVECASSPSGKKSKGTYCKRFIHKRCGNVTRKKFRMKISVEYLHCSNCNDIIALPFNHITDDRVFMLEIFKVFVGSNALPIDFKTFDHRAFTPLDVDINSECRNELQ